ncbi:hypothetical protein H8E88_19295 [candidate division KSB1 bacterium]|nr:hypothetical protein [candidate division KSB1 bacterium]
MANITMIELTLEMKHSTTMAVLFSDGDNEFWLPKSQIDYEILPNQKDVLSPACVVEMPEWLAIEKELI